MGLGLGTKHQIVFLPEVGEKPVAKRRWPLYVALGAQLVILAFLPGHKYQAAAAGKTIVLDVASLDPVDPLRGRYVDLDYLAGAGEAIEQLPGYDALQATDGATTWLTMAGGIGPDASWRPVAIAFAQPPAPKAGQLLLAGTMRDGAIDFGIDRYHVDASLGDELEAAMAGTKTRAEVRVDPQGHPALVGLHVGAKRF